MYVILLQGIFTLFGKILLLFPLLGLLACTQAAPQAAPIPITVQLSWFHQAEFAGFYAAAQNGYYAEEGLQVSFLEGGPEVDFISPVAAGKAQFGVAQPANLILARANGEPVRSIAVIYRRSPIVFVSHADLGITRPQEFAGKKIRSAITLDQTLRAVMARVGVQPDQYEVIHLPGDVALFASGEIPVWAGFINVFVVDVKRAGYEVNIIYPDDYGIHFYGDVLITTDQLIANDPGLVERFTRATLKGWTYAVENPEEIGAIVRNYKTDADEEVETAKMIASLPLVNTGEDFIGWIKPNVWESMEMILREQGVLAKELDVAQVYTLQFLQKIYSLEAP
jgi:NitT/TauT family transport system substrate-binding protein